MVKYPSRNFPRLTKGHTKINQLTINQLEFVQRKWNGHFATISMLESYEYLGPIRNEKELEDIRNWTFDNLIMLSGDVLRKDTLKLETLEDYEEIGIPRLEPMKAQLEHRKNRRIHARFLYSKILDEIKLGFRVIKLNWKAGNNSFSTLAVSSVSGLKHDSMLSNMFNVESEEVEKEAIMSDCKRRRVTWIFTNTTRGKVTACLTAICTNPIQCDGSAEGWMNLGDYVSQLVPFPGAPVGNCCRSTWIWGLMTPLVSGTVTIAAAAPGVRATGTITFSGVGSRAGGSVTMRDCCPAIPTGTTTGGTIGGTSVGTSGDENEISGDPTCESIFPALPKCKNVDESYDLTSFEELEDAIRRGAGLPDNHPVRPERARQNDEGDYPGVGWHYNFYDDRDGGKPIGGGFGIQCCKDTEAGPNTSNWRYKYTG